MNTIHIYTQTYLHIYIYIYIYIYISNFICTLYIVQCISLRSPIYSYSDYIHDKSNYKKLNLVLKCKRTYASPVLKPVLKHNKGSLTVAIFSGLTL